jgi:hypothetical protein
VAILSREPFLRPPLDGWPGLNCVFPLLNDYLLMLGPGVLRHGGVRVVVEHVLPDLIEINLPPHLHMLVIPYLQAISL